MSKIPMDEMLYDLKNTENDVRNLMAITNALLELMKSPDEDRSGFRIDLLKFENLLSDGIRLRDKIQQRISEDK